MSHSDRNELVRLLATIETEAQRHVGVDQYEHLLVELLALLDSGLVERSTALAELRRLATEWPWGAVEVLEFTMRRLRWPEIRAALEDQHAHGADFRIRDLARQALEVFDDDWPGGEIYETYRTRR